MEIKTTLTYFSLCLFLLTLTACEVGPDYAKPDIALPKTWIESDEFKKKTEAVEQEWWKNFNDPVLTKLLSAAVEKNLDLQMAEARLVESRAQRSVADAGLLPTGDLKGKIEHVGLPSSLPLPGISNPLDLYQAQFDASWELDLFGGHRRDIEAANASLEASAASRDGVLVSLRAEVVRSYIDIRKSQAQINVTEDRLKADQNAAQIEEERFKVGQGPRLNLTESEATLERDRAQLHLDQAALSADELTLDVLLGENPGESRGEVEGGGPIPSANRDFVLAAPASVIADRPDIREAERQLAASTARQGGAVTKFFPDVSLSGFFGVLNTNAGNLLTSASKSYMASGTILWPIFSYGSLSANLDVANTQQQEAMLAYQKTILAALSDVEKSLNAYREQDKYCQSLELSLEADQRATDVAEERYKGGATSFREVLDARRLLYTAQSQGIEAKAETSSKLVALYKSLGGGWRK